MYRKSLTKSNVIDIYQNKTANWILKADWSSSPTTNYSNNVFYIEDYNFNKGYAFSENELLSSGPGRSSLNGTFISPTAAWTLDETSGTRNDSFGTAHL